MRRREFLKTPAAATLAGVSPAAGAAPHARETVAPWRANWIWTYFENGLDYPAVEQQSPRNSYFYFRKTFELSGAPETAHARVSADSRYILFVNGVRIGFGPARSDPRWQSYDVYEREILAALRPGKNVVAALVHHVGEGTFAYIRGRSAFLFDGVLGGVEVVSDDTWKAAPGAPWQFVPHRLSLQTGFPEIYDARLEPAGWNTTEFDDSTWKKASLIGWPPVAPWGRMTPRDIPFFGEEDILPASALAMGHSVCMEREYVVDGREVRGNELQLAVNAAAPREVRFVIGCTSPYQVFAGGQLLAKRGPHPGGTSGYMVKEALPPARLAEGVTEIRIRFEPDSRIRHLYFGHLGAPDLVSYRDWSAPARENRQTEIAALQQTEEQRPGGAPAGAVTRIEPGPDTYVVFDFGKEVFGFPTLKIRSAGGGMIDLGYSELLENGRVVPNRAGCNNADRYILRPGAQQWQTFDKRAFRYMQVDFRKLTAPVEIESIGLRFSTYPVENKGRFECSDAALNKIWEVGRYTVQLNMDDAYTDCPWRERAGWVGDAHVEALVAYYTFGDSLLMRRCLRQVAQSQAGDGLTHGVVPAAMDHRLPSFTLLWILSIQDYYLHTGDDALVRELYPHVKRAIAFFERWTRQDGLVTDLQNHYWVFIDWTRMDSRGSTAALNSFYVGALDVAARIAETAGQPADAATYRRFAARTREAVRRHMWDPQRGVFADCYTAEGMSRAISQPSNSLAVLYGVAEPGRERAILDFILNPANQVVPVGSPYFSFYLLNALYRCGMHDEALEYIRKMWSRMLDAGATTWWERWDPHGSLCHGWSAGPTYDLIAEYAGIQPLEPGFRRVLIEPHAADLARVSASIPTPRGEVAVAWKRGENAFSAEITVPAGVPALISLPRLRPEWSRMMVDGRELGGTRVTPSRVQADWAGGGRHLFSLGV